MNRRILVLHGHKLVAENLLCDLQLFDAHIGNTRPLGHALIEQRLDAFAGLVVRHFRIMTVQVKQIDAVNAKSHRGLLAVFDQMLRLAVTRPNRLVTLPSAAQAHLGGHGDFLTRALPRVKRLTHQLFAGLFLFARRVVRPSGVDVTASGIQRGVQCFDTDIVTTIVFNGQRHFAMTDSRGVERSKITEQSHPDLLQQRTECLSECNLTSQPVSADSKPTKHARNAHVSDRRSCHHRNRRTNRRNHHRRNCRRNHWNFRTATPLKSSIEYQRNLIPTARQYHQNWR